MRFVIATGLEKKPGALFPTSKQKAENVKGQLFIYFCFVSKLCQFWGKTGKTSPSGAVVHQKFTINVSFVIHTLCTVGKSSIFWDMKNYVSSGGIRTRDLSVTISCSKLEVLVRIPPEKTLFFMSPKNANFSYCAQGMYYK